MEKHFKRSKNVKQVARFLFYTESILKMPKSVVKTARTEFFAVFNTDFGIFSINSYRVTHFFAVFNTDFGIFSINRTLGRRQK